VFIALGHNILSESGCPVPKIWKKGGYHCKNHKCINGNKGYDDVETAWDMCGKIDECGRIMQYGRGGKYYLRRLNDKYDSNPSLNYVDYFCEASECKDKSGETFCFLIELKKKCSKEKWMEQCRKTCTKCK